MFLLLVLFNYLWGADMVCECIQKEIALKVCAIGDSFIRDGVPVVDSDSFIDREDLAELGSLLEEYNRFHPVDVSKAESVIMSELRSVAEKEGLSYVYKDNGNRFPLYFGIVILGQLEV
jgi:hypothetical protein